MIVIIGLVVLLVAAMVGIVGVLRNAGPGRRGQVPLLGRWLDDRPTSSAGPRTFSPTRPILKR
jgi:hypothetical protein